MTSDDLDAAMSLLEQESVQTSASLTSHQATAQRDYQKILRSVNVTSFSQLETFYRCPRKFQMQKERAANASLARIEPQNVDFAFGHAVGAGIQNFLAYGDLDGALFAATMAWRAEFFAEIPKKRKNLWGALIAVEKFALSFRPDHLSDWDLLVLPNGKPAIEVSFSFHCGENGFKHYCHMDLALRNRVTKRLMVVDCKTTGSLQAEPASYANSSQALSYAIMLETCMPDEFVDYDVMYLVYSSSDREWTPLVFTKSVLEQAEWIKDILLTQDLIRTYNDVGFFPKRGAACFDFFRRCEFFGECNLTSDTPLPWLPEEEEAEKPDYVVDLATVVEKLKERKKSL